MSKLRRLVLEEDAQGLVEYGLILGLISVALVTVLGPSGIRGQLYNIFTEISTQLNMAGRKAKGS